MKEFKRHRNEVTSVKFHPNELVLATASLDRYCMPLYVRVCMCVTVHVSQDYKFLGFGNV